MSVRSILTFLLVFCGLVAVVVPVSMAHFHWSASGASTEQQMAVMDGSLALPQSPASALVCTGAAKSTASHAAMQDIAEHARSLTQQQHADEALSRYDDLQQLDPGFPGLHLDRATALMAARRYDEALREVNRQVSVSQCLARLSPAALESYCSREMPDHTPMLCSAQIKTMERTAHFQAAIVQMQLGKATDGNLADRDLPQAEDVAPPTPAPPDAELPRRISGNPVHRNASAPKHRAADALASAEGTDAALGAYSR